MNPITFLLADDGSGVRTKATHPYNYDPVLQFCVPGTVNVSMYSDRFSLWWKLDLLRAKYKEYFGESGDYWASRKPEAIQAFLRDMTGNAELKLLRVEEHCNQATGYPCWHFQCFDPQKQ